MAAKTVLIVGAKQGIGLELGKKFKDRGYEVYGTIRSFAKDEGQLGPLNEIASEVFEIDIQDEKMIEAAAKAWGDKPLDILVNCAGVGPKPVDWKDHTAEDLQNKFQVNVVVCLSPDLLKSLQSDEREGSVFNHKALLPCASLGREFRSHDRNITVNSIHPGWIPTAVSSFTGPDDIDVQTGLMIDTIEDMGPEETGKYVNAKGEDMPW